MVPAARALRLAGCGNLDLRLFDTACDNVDVAHDEEFFEVGCIIRAKHVGDSLGNRNLQHSFLALAHGFRVARFLDSLRHGVANLKQAREIRHNGLGGLALGQRRNEIGGLGPAGQLHAHGTTLAVALGLGIMLPHLVAGERQNRAHDAHEHLEDVHEHGLSRAARH